MKQTVIGIIVGFVVVSTLYFKLTEPTSIILENKSASHIVSIGEAPKSSSQIFDAKTATRVLTGSAVAESLSTKVNHLSASKNPSDAWQAYSLVSNCVNARRSENDGKPSNSSTACGDITPGQITARLQQLDTAAAAGVHGAFVALLNEGPTGYGFVLGTKEEMKDPVIASYYAKAQSAMEAAAKTGDLQAVQALSNQAFNADDKAGALTYWVALEDMSTAQGKPTDKIKQFVASLSSELTSEQRDEAFSRGTQFARAAQSSPYWNTP